MVFPRSICVQLIAIFLFSGSFSARAQVQCPGRKGQAITVMTYNIRMDASNDGPNAWPHRKDFLASQIEFHHPDVIGTQEGLPHQVDWLDEKLRDYARIGQGRRGGHQGEYAAIYYDRRRFTVVDSGTFWLSPTPSHVSVGWDAALPRICTWARLAERSPGQDFYVFNTHFDHVGKQARSQASKLILETADSLTESHVPYVIMGDLNLRPDSEPVQQFSVHLKDAFVHAPLRMGPEGTFTGFARKDRPEEPRIDYVFASRGTAFTRYATLSDELQGRRASDHRPVLTTLHLRPRPLIIAHRGASGHETENSLKSFQTAINMGADMVELDVFALRDGTLAVFHDKSLKRLTGTTGKIADLNAALLTDLKLLDGQSIPTLAEVLARIDKQLRINVELKNPGSAKAALATIDSFIEHEDWRIEDFQISSFDYDELRVMRQLNPSIEIAVLTSGPILSALPIAKEVKAQAINAHLLAINPRAIAKVHNMGMKVNIWTVKSHKELRRLTRMGVDGLITDFPDRAHAVFREEGL